jgi:hypothetical protein
LKRSLTNEKAAQTKRHIKRRIKEHANNMSPVQDVKQRHPLDADSTKSTTVYGATNRPTTQEHHQFDNTANLSPKTQYTPQDSSTWPWEFTTEPTDKPYLVVCHRMEDWFYPISGYFKILRIIDGEVPPWNATALLLHEDVYCENHTYVKEAVRRKGLAAFVDTSSNNIEVFKGWNDGVFWPETLQSTQVLKSIIDRPALVKMRGEVFWRHKDDSCSDVDFIVDRQTERLFDDCFTIHFIQGMSSAYLREHSEERAKGDLNVEQTFDLYTQKVVHPKANPDVPYTHSKFCSFLIRFDPHNLVGMFNSSSYDVDAIVRHMFFRQLSEYKSCERVTDCGGNPYNSYKCMMHHKFHITMENSMVGGYVSEKIFMGALGSGISIYFGAPDVGSYLNLKSFVYCNVSRSVIEEMRMFYPRKQKPRPFLFERSSTGFFPTEEELFDWADKYLRPELEPCVDKVIELDTNETLYRQVVSEPFITNLVVLNGQYPFRGIKLALDSLKN